MKLKNLSHRLQLKMKKSSKQQHELEKICRIHCMVKISGTRNAQKKFYIKISFIIIYIKVGRFV